MSVSYEESLLRTREILLRRQGYLVTSALGFTRAVEQCNEAQFDLFILGHSIPHGDKRKLVDAFRACCTAPVLALQRPGDAPLSGADAHCYSDDIQGLLKTVESMLQNLPKTEQLQTEQLQKSKRAQLSGSDIQKLATP